VQVATSLDVGTNGTGQLRQQCSLHEHKIPTFDSAVRIESCVKEKPFVKPIIKIPVFKEDEKILENINKTPEFRESERKPSIFSEKKIHIPRPSFSIIKIDNKIREKSEKLLKM